MRHDELILEQQCRELARQNGWLCCKLEKNGCKGIPDDLFISPDASNYLLIEFKKDTHQRPRPEQVRWLERLTNHGLLIGSLDDFKKALNIR